ncbi:CBS domain-containing protein [Bacillus sp. BRMEA1]|uniref:sugar phosphate nucleotidyltransferase n=1 Tax=Neobacillus endophyticus TaxID=2738405 RepID=UPI0015633537|nr:sugar phosphate nucleotidyltransferase [Neobacillus endophyticus]NRD79384.1 CBS domain-containing protein [Neobacillus endophyticus]
MEIKNLIVSESTTILNTMKTLDATGKRVALVCNESKLLGVVTDGDIRRFILSNGNLNSEVKEITNYNYKYVDVNNQESAFEVMKKYSLSCVPVIDKHKNIISIVFWNDEKIIMQNKFVDSVPVIIMAGGKGTRLYPYTKVLPKPLIPVGDKTITEHIMDRFESAGCTDFFMIVNHKRNMIKSYFSDEDLSYNVKYIDENNAMGTGGGLKLLKGTIEETFFMTNCDILLEYDYSKIYEHHKKNKHIITIVCAIKNIEIPYGTVEINNVGQIISLIEKPNLSLLTNTGFYIIEPDFLNYIPDDTFIHITDVIQKCIENGESIGMFPVTEKCWYDMGQHEKMEEMSKYLEQLKVQK